MCFVHPEYVDVQGWIVMTLNRLLMMTIVVGPITAVTPRPRAVEGAEEAVVVHWTVTEVYGVPATSVHAQRRITHVLPHVTY